MRRSIFITLLFVSLCYTAPPEPKPNNTTAIPQENITINENKTENHLSISNHTMKTDKEEDKPGVINDPNSSNVPSSKTDTTPSANSAVPTKTPNSSLSTKAMPVPSSSEKPIPSSSESPGTTTAIPTTTVHTTTEPTTPVTTTQKPTDKPTTPKPPPTTVVPPHSSTPNVTSAPIVTTTATPTKGRTFDGASFLGGMILSFGIVAIGLLGFRYYKSHSEQNYHTL